jgi:hypothetical protein
MYRITHGDVGVGVVEGEGEGVFVEGPVPPSPDIK